MRLAAGLRPGPARGAIWRCPDRLAAIRGRGGKGRERLGIGRGKGREGKDVKE